jgi:hypothetical protein
MSERNTALLVPGHVDPEEVLGILALVPGVGPEALTGEEAPRIGHGQRNGRDFTFIGWRLFEIGGLTLLERSDEVDSDEPEVFVGDRLSSRYEDAVFLLYDEETAFGGFTWFHAGRLEDRKAIDGRWGEVVSRTLREERVLEDIDPSDWVWPRLAELVDEGSRRVLGNPGLRNDDDIAALIASTDPQVHAAAAPAPAPEPPRERKRDKLLGLVKGLWKR